MESIETVAEGESPVNGKWTVEHVKGSDDKIFRRLIFMNSSSLIQSEVEVFSKSFNNNIPKFRHLFRNSKRQIQDARRLFEVIFENIFKYLIKAHEMTNGFGLNRFTLL